MSSQNKTPTDRLYEYRILYNAGADTAVQNSYHYYNAFNAPQALDFHLKMLKRKKVSAQTLKIEKFNPFSRRWEDESSILESLYGNIN